MWWCLGELAFEGKGCKICYEVTECLNASVSDYRNFLTDCDTVCHLSVETNIQPRPLPFNPNLMSDQCVCVCVSQQSCPYMLNICTARNQIFCTYWFHLSNLASSQSSFFPPLGLRVVISLFTLLSSSSSPLTETLEWCFHCHPAQRLQQNPVQVGRLNKHPFVRGWRGLVLLIRR